MLAPALGRMHQVVHGSRGAAPWAQQQHKGGARGTAQQAVDVLHALFAGHGSADCQVLDQQALGAGAWPACALPLVQALPGQAPAGLAGAAPARRRPAPLHARAPPPPRSLSVS